MAAGTELAGRAVLVTRPQHQAGALAQLIRSHGGEPVLFPTIEIRDAPDPQPLMRAVADRAAFDLAVFASANAVAKAWPRFAASGGFSPRTRFAAVGEGTASELRAAGAVDVIVPAQGADSEALLAQAVLRDVSGRRVAIFSGVGGRDLLATELAARGAVVAVVPCYERVRPDTPSGPVRARIASGSIAAVTATSGEGVRNLYAMLAADAAALAKLPHVVPHERIAQAARDCGVVVVHVCGSGDAAMVSALIALLRVGLVAAGS